MKNASHHPEGIKFGTKFTAPGFPAEAHLAVAPRPKQVSFDGKPRSLMPSVRCLSFFKSGSLSCLEGRVAQTESVT